MIKRFAILPLCLLVIASCKEKGPAIDFGPKASDTAYMASVETRKSRMVLVEEFTGVSCPSCPAGHAILKSLEDANPDRLAVIGIQIFGPGQSAPVDKDTAKTKHDNRTQVGTDLGNGIYGTNNGLPSAGIDRSGGNGQHIYSDKGSWAAAIGARLPIVTNANIAITSTYNAASRQAAITVRVAYTGAVTGGQALNVALIENNIIDAQENGLDYVQNYTHQHVLRDILTNPTGTAILTGINIQPGQVYERTFVYTINADWNPDNCRIVAYVANNNGADKEVQQAAEISLK